MAVFRFSGHHVGGPGRPGAFRTLAGTHIPLGAPGISLESVFSRKGETANRDAVILQHNAVAAQFDSETHNSVHITNSAPHIERLNMGWSQQTPPGFFERALYAAKKAIVGTWRLKEIP